MYLVSLVQNWSESLLGFIGIVAQTLTVMYMNHACWSRLSFIKVEMISSCAVTFSLREQTSSSKVLIYPNCDIWTIMMLLALDQASIV